MAEYIEREALGTALNRRLSDLLNRYGEHDHYSSGYAECVDAVEDFPAAADVAPVVHARWVDDKCSNCGADIPTDDAHDAIFGSECHFCYYCGAKMDGEP